MTAPRSPIGERLLRREDPKLLTGRGRYLADHDLPGLCHVALVRSPVAHAQVRRIDTIAGARLPGVVAVVSQADLTAAGARPFRHLLPIPFAKPLSWDVLATDAVRFVGEPIVAVVAISRAVAEDAVELVDIAYNELRPVVGATAAMQPGAPLLYPEWGTNEFLHLASATPGVDAALAAAPHRIDVHLENHRIAGLPLEGHGAQATFDEASGVVTLLSSNQQPYQLRTVVADICGLSEADVRVIAPDMGGGFGNKQHFTREECLVAMLARICGRPVRWVQDRTEGLIASIHSRPQDHDVTVGFDDDGRVLALRVDVVSDIGNPVLYFSGIGPSLVTVGSLEGPYVIPELRWSLSCVVTTTCPVGAYRGFGQPQSHFTTERVMDLIAAELALDPAEVRRRNLIPDAPRPAYSHGGARIDCGPLGAQLDELLVSFGYDRWRARQAAIRADGRWVGIGVSAMVNGVAPSQFGVAGRFGSWEVATVSVLPDGRVTVVVGTKSQGQGHETAFAQVAAAALGVDPAMVSVSDGDTAALPGGMGTWGSRSAVMGGGAVIRAAQQVRAKMEHIALAMRRAGLPCEFVDVATEAWWHVHRLPPDVTPGLTATVVYSPGNTKPVPDERGQTNFDETFSSSMTAVAVEVDAATGTVSVLDAAMVVDCGVVINPTVVEGQLQGAFAQGLGAVLLEEVRYSPDGQPLTTTLLDYTIPEAPDVPVIRVVHRPTPSETAGGFRGVGEAGIIAAPSVIASAVEDALRPLGVRITTTRLHACELRRLLREAGYRPDAASFAGTG